eukprot:GHVT01045914.1.p1 GENE.GHVT01045914.1~~GHVT01045914.1.p1  ORF type:complete len:152 (+),score=32.86 GHVT01045914.1:2-457(+)
MFPSSSPATCLGLACCLRALATELRRGYGPAALTDTGNLKLPSGKEVPHRNVAFVFRQRLTARQPHGPHLAGLRDDATAVKSAALKLATARTSTGRSLGLSLMSPAAAAVQRRVRRATRNALRRHQHSHMRLGVAANNLQKVILRQTKFFL